MFSSHLSEAYPSLEIAVNVLHATLGYGIDWMDGMHQFRHIKQAEAVEAWERGPVRFTLACCCLVIGRWKFPQILARAQAQQNVAGMIWVRGSVHGQ